MTTTKLPALRELGDARHILDEFLLETEGEVTPEIETLWDQLDGDINQKIEAWALWVTDRSAAAKLIKEEEQRLAARRKALENAVERSKDALKFQMERIGKTKVNGLLVSVGIQNNPPAVTCTVTDDELRDAYLADDLLGRFVRETVSYRIDRDAVLAAHKAGDPIPQEIAVTVGSHIRIR